MRLKWLTGYSTLVADLLDASRRGDVLTIDCILLGSLTANSCNEFGVTPLMMASWGGSLACVKHLVALGSNIDAKQFNGHTPLFHGVMSDRFDCVSYLIGAGADVDAQDDQGRTLANICAREGYTEYLDYFLWAGANPFIPDNEGLDCFKSAHLCGSESTLSVLDSWRLRARYSTGSNSDSIGL